MIDRAVVFLPAEWSVPTPHPTTYGDGGRLKMRAGRVIRGPRVVDPEDVVPVEQLKPVEGRVLE